MVWCVPVGIDSDIGYLQPGTESCEAMCTWGWIGSVHRVHYGQQGVCFWDEGYHSRGSDYYHWECRRKLIFSGGVMDNVLIMINGVS